MGLIACVLMIMTLVNDVSVDRKTCV